MDYMDYIILTVCIMVWIGCVIGFKILLDQAAQKDAEETKRQTLKKQQAEDAAPVPSQKNSHPVL